MSFSFCVQQLPYVVVTAAIFVGSFLQSSAQAPLKQWDQAFGGTHDEFLYTVATTSDGGCILGGTSSSGRSGEKTQPNQGPASTQDCWIVRVDQSGNKLWDRTLGGSENETIAALLATADGGSILGGSSFSGVSGTKTTPNVGNSDFWLVKLDAEGNPQWERVYGGSGAESINTVLATRDGGYLLGGSSTSGSEGDKTQASRGGNDYWLVKVDAQGRKQWDRTYGGDSTDVLRAAQQTSDGGYLLGGGSLSGRNGDKSQPNQGESDFWVIRLDAQGNKLWDRTFGGSKGESVTALQLTPDGGCVLAGTSFSPRSGDKTEDSMQGDFWVVKLDANGRKQWDRTIGGNDLDVLDDLQVAPDGGFFLGGVSQSPISRDRTHARRGTYDGWLVKLTAAGTTQWDVAYGGSAYNRLRAIRFASDGGLLLGLDSSSGWSGDKTSYSRGRTDYWLLKLRAETVTATRAARQGQPLRVYPSPATATITLSLPADAPRTGLQLSLQDATGRVVLRRTLAVVAGADVPVAVGVQSAGLYLLRVIGPNSFVAAQRILLE